MNFGVPSKKQRREEKYPNKAVMTLSEDGGKGTSRTINFNEKACDLLGLDEKKASIAFSFDGGVFVANGDQAEIPKEYSINVTKTLPRRVSSKKTYEYISNLLGLDNSQENEFELKSTDKVDGQPIVFEVVDLVIIPEGNLTRDLDASDVQDDAQDVNFDFQQDEAPEVVQSN